MLAIENLYKIFGDAPQQALDLAREGVDKDEVFRRTGSVVAVDDVSFSVPQSEIFVVMGLSGSGKSTLIRCINRLIEPTGGKVLLGEEDVTAASPAELRQIRLRRVAMVFQHFALLPHKTVAENAAYGLKARGVEHRERRDKALAALDTVGLAAWADSFPANLSGGMQQRVGLARALAVDPEVLLMDEPFSALDPLIRRDMQDELLELQHKLKTTIVFITHDLQEALKIGDHIAIMKQGRFVQVGSPEEIVTAPAEDYVAEFIKDVDRSRVLTFSSMMRPAETVAASAPAGELSSRLLKGGALFVVDEKGRPLGIIDSSSLEGASPSSKARELMDANFGRVKAREHIFEAFGRIRARRPLAVVESDGRLAGMVDPIDLFAHLGPKESDEAESAPGKPVRAEEEVTQWTG